MADAPCRVCGSHRHVHLCRTANEHSATRWLDNYRCLACGSVFIGNALAPAELSEAYAALDEAAYYDETAQASAPKFAAAADDIAALVPRDAALLDVGGGNGAFARALHGSGFSNLSIHEIPGGELSNLPPSVRNIYRDDDYASLPGGAFDIVSMMDVLEHVPDLAATLSGVQRVLRPGGTLYVHTPVVTVLDRLMHAVQKFPLIGGVGRAWQRTRTSIYHLQNFTPRALRLLMARYGFNVVRLARINELSWPIDYYVRVYLVQLRGMPSFLVRPVTLLLTPLLRSRLNANKAVLVARRRG
ncbi:MAG: class I SAM-dependent methyltransferase [Pseudolabrys sp.]|nr:class I SAM-dependent methyltransferase [Pseudolabrys sp.]